MLDFIDGPDGHGVERCHGRYFKPTLGNACRDILDGFWYPASGGHFHNVSRWVAILAFNHGRIVFCLQHLNACNAANLKQAQG